MQKGKGSKWKNGQGRWKVERERNHEDNWERKQKVQRRVRDTEKDRKLKHFLPFSCIPPAFPCTEKAE
jgi:hypothetical protein